LDNIKTMAGSLNKKEFTMRLQKLLKHSADKSRGEGQRGSSAKAVKCLTKQLRQCEEEADMEQEHKPVRVNSFQLFGKFLRKKNPEKATKTRILKKWNKMTEEQKEPFAKKARKMNRKLDAWKEDNAPKKKAPNNYQRFVSAMSKYGGLKVTEMSQPWKDFKRKHGNDKQEQLDEIEKLVKKGRREQKARKARDDSDEEESEEEEEKGGEDEGDSD
jgi:hypothetical protein